MTKKISFALFAILLQALLFSSCVTTKIVSNKDASYTKKLKKIYIICNLGKDESNFNERLFDTLKNNLLRNKIAVEGFIRNPVALETDQDIIKKINDYDPDALMVVKQTHVTYINGGPGAGKFEVSLIDKLTQKSIWKAEIDLTGPWWEAASSNSVIEKLIMKLKEDQLI